MLRIIFDKEDTMYKTTITDNQNIHRVDMKLDTGAPITIICLPSLIQLSKESIETVLQKIDNYLTKESPLSMGVYGNSNGKNSKSQNIQRNFVPYIIKDVNFGNSKFKFFLFWVDITPYLKYKQETNEESFITVLDYIKPTANLFGFDYISIGKKYFDKNDNFIIEYNSCFEPINLQSKHKYLSNVDDNTHNIDELQNIKNMSDTKYTYNLTKESFSKSTLQHKAIERVLQYSKKLGHYIEYNNKQVQIPVKMIRRDKNNRQYCVIDNKIVYLKKSYNQFR